MLLIRRVIPVPSSPHTSGTPSRCKARPERAALFPHNSDRRSSRRLLHRTSHPSVRRRPLDRDPHPGRHLVQRRPHAAPYHLVLASHIPFQLVTNAKSFYIYYGHMLITSSTKIPKFLEILHSPLSITRTSAPAPSLPCHADPAISRPKSTLSRPRKPRPPPRSPPAAPSNALNPTTKQAIAPNISLALRQAGSYNGQWFTGLCAP